MKTKLIPTLAALPLLFLLLLTAGGNALAQNGGQAEKLKIGIVDVLAFRDGIGELKAKYDKLQTEFATADREIQSMQTKLASQEKVLNENKNLTPQQAAKLSDEFEQGKKEYNRKVEDFQAQVRKREDDETGPIKEKLGKFLEQYCAKRNITYVFDGRALQETGIVIYAAPTANITDDFIKEYNKAYPAPAGAASAK
ncbi:MAG TPA: OmpH family outer membrane protein [Blastocatellia bacterium]|nr:OmpH family outer membrane protein [Blastocatellia bacterium]HMV83187.1 OmpH family outer membrane protein [Blastocatellia bacterium]HMX28874.1 OmpH family outer membrane protein [Blastocatellia bacterium]HMZ20719.1 OmpH family outer membrane protein [Blastocatellia bacterium]HNG31191.1 OmpH family outer membrane protein [Blastocatellia bacterium]